MAVVPILIAVVIGLVAGFLRKGRLRAMAHTRLRSRLLLAVALASAVVLDVVDVPRPAIWAIVGLASGLAFAGRNLHLVGMSIVAVGLAANLVPIVVNGAMPVRPDALVAADMVGSDDLDRVVLDGARELADDDTRLDFMGDVIPVALTGQVLSFGDLIILVGLADVVANLMLRRGRRPTSVESLASPADAGWWTSPTDAAQPAAITTASPDQDWGTAPPPEPVSASQYSASPERSAPATVDAATRAAADGTGSVAVVERPHPRHSR